MADATLETGTRTGVLDAPESLDCRPADDLETPRERSVTIETGRPGRDSRQARLARARRLLRREIEYIWSDEFQAKDAGAKILTPRASSEHRSDDGDFLTKPPPQTPAYLASLYRFPLLSPDEERHLFRKMNYLKYRAALLRESLDPADPNPGLMDDIEGLLREALTVRNAIIRANLRLVVSIAKRLVDRANHFDDLVSDGNVPLMRAVEIFDFERGTRFSTYATWAIRNTLFRSTPRRRRQRQRFPTAAGDLFQTVRDSRQPASQLETEHRRTARAVHRMLSHLDGRDRYIVESRYGLDAVGRPRRFREIAEKLNISTERVRQLLARSLRRLRESPEHREIEPS